ncbi:DUF2490 domain-containing protein [Roseivirga sp.]|uniref:DUF2490 domain-containing protein n=1 Tax=Roseivirga sp. TaxID=1964215 RepID=UPI003B51C925
MNTKTFTLLLATFLSFSNLAAQNRYQSGLLPSINLNKKLNSAYALNLKIESREQLAAGFIGNGNGLDHDHLLTDLTFLGSRKIGLTEKLVLGYLLRLNNGEVIHRSIQQFSFVSSLRGIKLGHRLGTDQTFERNEPTVFRLRYRVSTELPLEGTNTDPEEFYLKLNNELIQSWSQDRQLLEYRFGPFIGYFLNPKNRFELGLDYRNQSILEAPTRHSYWLSMNWYYNL